MSFLNRILSRAATPGVTQAPLARPKGGSWLARLDAGEDDMAQALHRQEDEEELQTLRRQDQEEESLQPLHRQEQEDEEGAQALRRQKQEDEESLQPLHRQEQEDEESAQALRRQAQEEEENAQPLHRQQQEDEASLQPLRRQEQEEEESAQPLRRVTPPDAQHLTAENSPQPDALDPEPAMSALRALRREAVLPGAGIPAAGTPPLADTPPATPAPEASEAADAAWTDRPPSIPTAQDDFIPAPRTTQGAAERPRVIIDQVDVVIHEEAAATAPASPTAALGRALKAKYLGGL